MPPPPGWYTDPDTGNRRWWDGRQWGPASAAPPARSGGDNKVFAVLAHLGVAVFAIVVPLVIYLTVGKDDPDVRHHAREALNFQISFFVVWVLGGVVTMATMFSSAVTGAGGEPPVFFFVMFPLMFLLFFIAIAFSIYRPGGPRPPVALSREHPARRSCRGPPAAGQVTLRVGRIPGLPAGSSAGLRTALVEVQWQPAPGPPPAHTAPSPPCSPQASRSAPWRSPRPRPRPATATRTRNGPPPPGVRRHPGTASR